MRGTSVPTNDDGSQAGLIGEGGVLPSADAQPTMAAAGDEAAEAADASDHEAWQIDRALLDAFRRGDRAALGHIYFLYVEKVATLLRSGFSIRDRGLFVPGVPAGDGESDLLQEVFVRAFAPAARLAYDGLRPYGPYLLRIARNLLVDRQRQHKRQPAAPGNIDPEEQASSVEQEVSRDEELHWARLSAVTNEYLQGLDSESRTFVRLRFEEELSQQEVALRMGASRRRVRTLEVRVQAGLRRHLKRHALDAEAPRPGRHAPLTSPDTAGRSPLR